jgi:hypothetical protein
MNEEQKLMLKAKEELDAKVVAIAENPFLKTAELTVLANEPYDAELPMPEIITEIAKTASIAKGADYEYWAVSASAKTVYTVTNGSVTQAQISPSSPSDLTFSHYDTPEDYIYIPDMLESKYDSVALKAKDQQEALNRLENKLTLDAVIAAAVSASNTFANDSGDTKIDFAKLVEMVRSMAKYGTKLVLLSGSTVTTDLVLMDYDTDKNREVSIEKAGISKWIKVENYQYTHSGTQTVLAVDKAVLVATSDSMDNRPVHVVRRKVNVPGAGEKERLIVVAGPGHFVGSARKLAFAIVTYESLGIVVVNGEACAVYKSASIYA